MATIQFRYLMGGRGDGVSNGRGNSDESGFAQCLTLSELCEVGCTGSSNGFAVGRGLPNATGDGSGPSCGNIDCKGFGSGAVDGKGSINFCGG